MGPWLWGNAMIGESLDRTAADVLVHKLREFGVERMFGIPGDAINGVVDAIRRHPKVEFIQVRHEEAGAFMASAYAKLTGNLGVCLGTAGPGAIHLLNGLYDAKLDHAPVLAITGQVDSDVIGTHYFQEVNLQHLFDDVAVYNARVATPDQVAHIVTLAAREALSKKGVAQISFPLDIPNRMVSRDAPDFPAGYTDEVPVPDPEQMERAIRALNEGKNIAILVGRGALGAGEEMGALAERLGAPIVKTLLAKEVLPDDHPLVIGGLGLLGTRPGQEAMEHAKTLLMVGTSFPFTEYLPDDALTIQIDSNPAAIGLRTKVDVPLLGDARSTLAELNRRVELRKNRGFLDTYLKATETWWERMEKEEGKDTVPLAPAALAKAVSDAAAVDAIVSVDVGNVTTWTARHFRATAWRRFIFSGNLASMGFGLPGALAAQLAYPDRQCLALCGDGGFTMLMGDFVTAVKYLLPVKVVVFNNSKLAMIKYEQEVMGHPDFGTDLQPIDFAMFAEACGGQGYRVEEPADLRDTVERFLAEEGPALLDAVVDPNVPPLPPYVKVEQAYRYVWALFREKFPWTRKEEGD
ncbi:MAG: thiamine pyrophosphate-dependent enzyme [Thermoplasmata archaeon]